jgi:beta-glucosidase
LKGFAKVHLAAGETRTVTFELGPRAFQYYDVKSAGWKADADEFTLSVGASSRDLRQEAKLVW